MQFFRLYPLCFAEYLQATGNNEAANIVLGSPQTVSQTIHEFLCEELRRYFFIGGMPESVIAYVETGSMRESFEVQAEICDTYRLDFSKYSLHLFLETYKNSPKGIVFSIRPYAEPAEKNIVFMPLYFAFSATRESSRWTASSSA